MNNIYRNIVSLIYSQFSNAKNDKKIKELEIIGLIYLSWIWRSILTFPIFWVAGFIIGISVGIINWWFNINIDLNHPIMKYSLMVFFFVVGVLLNAYFLWIAYNVHKEKLLKNIQLELNSGYK